MTVGTSAILAILHDEPEMPTFVSLIDQAPRRPIPAVSVLAASMVLEGRQGDDAGSDLDRFLRKASIEEVVPFDEEQLEAARTAFRRFGKGRHAAGLNFGEPLLFKSADFAATDVARATE